MNEKKCRKEPRFWFLDFFKEAHEKDILESIKKGELTCLVDEKAGGIIAYFLYSKGREEEILKKINRVR